ncbi:MAG: hypothetical protein RBG13Loki_2720 [Promethearchaeota archaeon CR_4]|nr:MAG: hypothetical protein RBG13Loki_2720 [Candidatus Lokiarchaeota archaeon CR_4]
MTEQIINLVGASPYFNEWKQEFVADLEAQYPGRVVERGKDIQVVAGRYSSEINIEKNQYDINVSITSMRSGNSGGGAFLGFCLLLMAVLFLFSAWRFAFMPFFFVSPFWIIFFIVIFAIPGSGHSHSSLVGPISRMARNSWEKVSLRNKKNTEEPSVGKKSAEIVKQDIAGGNTMKKVVNNERPPDEEYLLSPAAAEAARTPAPVKKVDQELKLKDGTGIFCPYCGAKHEYGAKFCGNCGSVLISQ